MIIWINLKFFKWIIILALQIIVFINQVYTKPKNEFCHGCDTCVNDVLSCKEKHFDQVPQKIPKTIRYLQFEEVTFKRPFLDRFDFINISPEKCCKVLFNVHFKNTNINLVKRRTFSPLKTLKIFLIKSDKRLTIENEAFDGLHMTLVHLQSPNLDLNVDAFKGSTIKGLKLSNCSLTHLNYQLIEPIMYSLKRLYIQNNKIKVIDNRFSGLFKKLNEIDMINNPLNCKCSMKWLKDVFKYRKSQGKTQASSFDKKEIIPTCAQPLYLKGQKIHHIQYNEFNCQKPSLNTLKIDFTSLHSSSLTCHAYHPIKQSNLLVRWLTTNTTSPIKIGNDEYFHQPDDTIHVKQVNPIDIYKCVANNVNGNVTAIVRITWPKFTLNSTNTNTQIQLNKWPNHNNNDNGNEEYLFQKRFTLLEMLGAVIGTFTMTLLLFLLLYKLLFIRHNKKTLFLPHKSNNITSSNMTHSNSNSNSNNINNNINGAFYNDNNLGLNNSMLLSNNSYTTYDAAIYNESLTYDIPGNSMGTNLISKSNNPNNNMSNNELNTNPNHHNAMLTMPNLSHNYSVNSCNNTPEHFLDFKTQRKLYKP